MVMVMGNLEWKNSMTNGHWKWLSPWMMIIIMVILLNEQLILIIMMMMMIITGHGWFSYWSYIHWWWSFWMGLWLSSVCCVASSTEITELESILENWTMWIIMTNLLSMRISFKLIGNKPLDLCEFLNHQFWFWLHL